MEWIAELSNFLRFLGDDITKTLTNQGALPWLTPIENQKMQAALTPL